MELLTKITDAYGLFSIDNKEDLKQVLELYRDSLNKIEPDNMKNFLMLYDVLERYALNNKNFQVYTQENFSFLGPENCETLQDFFNEVDKKRRQSVIVDNSIKYDFVKISIQRITEFKSFFHHNGYTEYFYQDLTKKQLRGLKNIVKLLNEKQDERL